MSRINFIETVLSEACEAMGLGETAFDDQGRLTLRFHETPVTFAYAAEPIEMLWLHVELGAIPEEGANGPQFLLTLATDCWGLNRMSIGLAEDGRSAWGYTGIAAFQLTRELLEQTLRNLLEVAMPIRERIARREFALDLQVDRGSSPTERTAGMIRV